MLPSLLLSLLVLAKNHTKTTHVHSERHWFTRCAVCGMHSWSEFLWLVHGSRKMTSQTMIGHTNYSISFLSPCTRMPQAHPAAASLFMYCAGAPYVRVGYSGLDPRFNPQGRVWRKGLGNNLALKCLAGMPWFLTLANFFQMFNAIGQIPLQFSKFLCSTVYSLPVISWTRTLVGCSDVFFWLQQE